MITRMRSARAVGEYAPSSKSAEEIRSLWQWVETRLNGDVTAGEQRARELGATPFPIMLTPTPAQQATPTAAANRLPAPAEADASWDACL
jgi:chromosome partitioning protein